MVALDRTTVSALETITDAFSTIASTDLTRTMSAVSDDVAAIVSGTDEMYVAVAFDVMDADTEADADASM